MGDAIRDAKDRLGTMHDFLARHNLIKRGAYRCPSPEHEDRHPSASIYTAPDGDERVHCHSCGFDEDVLGVAKALGEPVDLRGYARKRPKLPPPAEPDQVVADVRILLERRPVFVTEWHAAKLLASLTERDAARDLEASRSFLEAAGCDVGLIEATASLVRDVALGRYGSGWGKRGPAPAVEMLVREIEREHG